MIKRRRHTAAVPLSLGKYVPRINMRMIRRLPKTVALSTTYGQCCGQLMALGNWDYYCEICGRLERKIVETGKSFQDIEQTNVRQMTGSGKGRYYGTSSYSKIQLKNIQVMLTQRTRDYRKEPIPQQILDYVAVQYNMLQKNVRETKWDPEANTSRTQKFVKRKCMREEIIAALIFFRCNSQKICRKRAVIAEFMQLDNNGFSKGESKVRELQAAGKIDAVVDVMDARSFATRYLTALEIEENQHVFVEFIAELLREAGVYNVGIDQYVASKVAACISLIAANLKLPITTRQIECATDNTKAGTWSKFCKELAIHADLFGAIFDKYGIPRQNAHKQRKSKKGAV